MDSMHVLFVFKQTWFFPLHSLTVTYCWMYIAPQMTAQDGGWRAVWRVAMVSACDYVCWTRKSQVLSFMTYMITFYDMFAHQNSATVVNLDVEERRAPGRTFHMFLCSRKDLWFSMESTKDEISPKSHGVACSAPAIYLSTAPTVSGRNMKYKS